MKKIAFFGLGSMGLPMAINLVNVGYKVIGFDISEKALLEFKRKGGLVASTDVEATKGADILILMVVNSEQAFSILSREEILNSLNNNAVVILMATCPSSDVNEMDALVKSSGKRFIDSPVSGGVAGAIDASLTIMVAGSETDFEELKPVFNVLGKRIYHVGLHAGQGAMAKTVNQLLCGVHIAVIAEAFSLARSVDMDLNVILDIMKGSSASSWMLHDRGARMLQEEPEVTSAVDIFVKDLNIVLETGKANKCALPIASASQQMFLATSGRGDGKADDSQVIRSYYVLNGRK